MKTVEFDGREWRVGDEARYIARDANRITTWYNSKPVKVSNGWSSIIYEDGCSGIAQLVADDFLLSSWERSLTAIDETNTVQEGE